MKSALRFLLNGILWCAPVGVMAQSYEGFLYTNTGTTITITGYTGTNGLLTIPSAIDGLPVTGIGDSAFQWLLGSGSLASVTIPASVTTIGDYAFFEQAGTLTNVLIPNSVTSIGAYAFAVCPSLTNIAIPASVTNLGEAAFESCGIRGAIIPAAITSIADSAFAGSSFLQSLTLPDTVTSIGDRAFSGCGRLQALTIPDAVTNIGAAAFEGCQSLPSLTLPAGITTISDDAFNGCSRLTNLTIPGTVAIVGNNAFMGCSGLTRLTIGSGVASLGTWAFAGCSALTNLTIPASVTNIGPQAFDGAFTGPQWPYSFTLTLANGIADIQTAAFWGCQAATLVIPASVTNLEADAFGLCGMRNIIFEGLPPVADPSAFFGVGPALLYLPGTPGWGPTFDGHPTEPWLLPYPVILNRNSSVVGAQSNGFQFTISWAARSNVVIEATTSLSNPAWQPIATTALTNGAGQFTDPFWTNYPARFYRVRSP